MAEVIKDGVGFGFRPQYAWGEWLDGQTWKLTKGVDFTTSVINFRTGLYAAARVKGMKVHTKCTETDIIFQAYKP